MTSAARVDAAIPPSSAARETNPHGGAAMRASMPIGCATWIFAAFGLAMSGAIVSVDAPYTPGSPIGYRLGLIGALLMLVLLIYPLRKRWSVMSTWGPIRYWFHVHMVFGIAGPLMVLFHSTFHFGSVNAAVALGAMLVVAASGVIGRFLYARIHNGLYGSLSTLEQMLAEREKSESQVRRLLDSAPAIEPLLERTAALTQLASGNAYVRAWRFATLGWRIRRIRRQCNSVLRQMLNTRTADDGRTPEERQYYRAARKLIRTYLSAAQRAAQFRAYERLFSLWHVAHIPFIYLLVASALVHVIAVHMY